MTEETTSDTTTRVECSACGRDVVAKKDGQPRKHDCVSADPDPTPAEETAAAALEPLPELPAEASPDPAPPPAAKTAAPRSGRAVRRYCRVPNCGRAPRPNGVCASHRLHHGLIE